MTDSIWGGAYDAVLCKSEFEESEHPREPAGSARGGQFAPKGSGASAQSARWGSPKFSDYAYSKYGVQFTDRDIDTIVGINEKWMRGDRIAWGQVRSDAVRQWAKAANLAVNDKQTLKLRSLTRDEEVFAKFRAEDDMPPAALWRVFKQDIFTPDAGGVQGMSVVDSRGWSKLNIYPRGHKYFAERDQQAMERVLIELDKAGYVHTDFAGSIWRIEDMTRTDSAPMSN